MNLPSLDKYESLVAKGGYLVVNSSMVNRQVMRDDIHVITILANDIAESIGSKRSVNMVLLGGLLARMDLLSLEAVEEALEAHMPERLMKFLETNKTALREGAATVVV
jgi:2-oxoglutarate ferredoxin oxidoreductase subunit gamma